MTTPTTIDCIPVHLLTEIFVGLPVKSLLRCKSVSKPWLSLISNPNFIKYHLKHISTTPGADQTLISIGEDDYSLSVLHLDSPHIRDPLGLPFSRGDYSLDPRFMLVGSCSGILCVSVYLWSRYFTRDEYNYHRKNPQIYIWNPATKQSKLIPLPNLRDEILSVAMGFGFDPVDNDCKVVRIVSSRRFKPKLGSTMSTEVYSANTNVWRKVKPEIPEDGDSLIDVPEYFRADARFDVCVNGFLCCLGLNGMMAFDLNTEVFTIGIELPKRSTDAYFSNFNDTIAVIISPNEQRDAYFSNFNDTIAVIISQSEQGHCLWTLDDEACLRGGGRKASWTAMLTIDVDLQVRRVCGCFNSGDFVLYTVNGEDIDGKHLLYNSHKKEARNSPVSIFFGDYRRSILKYNESLVSITGSKHVDWNAHEGYGSKHVDWNAHEGYQH